MNIFKIIMLKKAAKKGTKMAIEREIKILTAAAVTYGLHKGLKKAAEVYPKLHLLTKKRHA